MNKETKEYNPEFMEMAARLSYENIDKGGGPFGAVIVKDGEVVATGVNTVTLDNDPTAHAEVNLAACRSASVPITLVRANVKGSRIDRSTWLSAARWMIPSI